MSGPTEVPRRLGLLGGTFDPPHFGHLHLAEAACDQLRLDRVLWVVTADPPHKHGQDISALADRLDMVAAAIAPYPAFQISRVDIDRPGPHWAADTVRLLAGVYPGVDLYYLMGGDSLHDLPTWGRPLDFLAVTRLGVLRRPGDAVDLSGLEQVLPGIIRQVAFIDAPLLNLSGTAIRQRAAARASLAGWVPAAVARIIVERRLYQPAA